MPDSSWEDDDVMVAFQDRWNADSSLPVVVPGGLHAGRIVSGLPLPYGQIQVSQGPSPNTYPAPATPDGNSYHDYRHVILRVVGLKADVVKALGFVRAAFEWQPKAPVELAIPNAVLKHVKPLPGKLEQDPTKKAGEDHWIGEWHGEVWSVRDVPAGV